MFFGGTRCTQTHKDRDRQTDIREAGSRSMSVCVSLTLSQSYSFSLHTQTAICIAYIWRDKKATFPAITNILGTIFSCNCLEEIGIKSHLQSASMSITARQLYTERSAVTAHLYWLPLLKSGTLSRTMSSCQFSVAAWRLGLYRIYFFSNPASRILPNLEWQIRPQPETDFQIDCNFTNLM